MFGPDSREDSLLAEVAVDIHALNLGTFNYRIPSNLSGEVHLGSQVKVPFGRRLMEGFVVGFSTPDSIADPSVEMKDIQEVLTTGIEIGQDLIELAKRTAQAYVAPLITVLKCMMPPATVRTPARKSQVVHIAPDVQLTENTLRAIRKKAPAQAEVLEALYKAADRKMPLARLISKTGCSRTSVNSLATKGYVTFKQEPVIKASGFVAKMPAPPILDLTHDQTIALDRIKTATMSGRNEVYLVFGVTSSGKTEVYLRAIDQVVSSGRQALVMVPEIGLTPQTAERFCQRFGDRVAIIHSSLSHSERSEQWRRIRRKEASVVVGVRSAIFSPFADLGIIVVDEEHETSYKQEETPRYNARDLAVLRARIGGIPVILGSATPSVESYYHGIQGRYHLLELPQRINQAPLPSVSLVDMREELKKGNRSIFSEALVDGIRKRLARREQTILFLNRRGFSTFVLCRECGHVLRCPNCDVSLTYHQGEKAVVCHYCGYTTRVPDTCPNCLGTKIRFFGAGTEKVEEEVKRLFPDARILRMDRDSIRRIGAANGIYQAFRSGNADILVGTQMVAKGLDIPNVTLVGVVSADTCLRLPDFRAAERTFSLLTQVAGRAGRGDRPGEVIVQSYDPSHYSIQMAKDHDYRSFFEQEIRLREQGKYPPFCSMAFLECTGPSLQKVIDDVEELARRLTSDLRGGDFEVLGPAPALVSRVSGRYRYRICVKGSNRDEMVDSIWRVLMDQTTSGNVQIKVDVDPISIS